MSSRVRTSEDNPIRVSWVTSHSRGKVGITFAPGKHAPSRWGAPHARDLAADLDRLAGELGVHDLVCLLEDHELIDLQIPGLVAEAQRRGLAVHRLRIPDLGVLASPDPVRAITSIMIASVEAGRNVVVHCAGGLGRSGTVVGCFLRELGMSPEDALLLLSRVRGEYCPETEAQRRFIADYSPARVYTEQLVGAVLGAAIGDAMGHPTEFSSLEEIRALHGPLGVTGFTLYWQRDGARFAPYTDDTQMAEVVLRVLVEGRAAGLDLDATMSLMAERFVAWSVAPQGGHRGPGNSCLAGCRRLAQGVPWAEAGGETAGGCGSVMRAYPFGLLFSGDLERAESWAVAHSKLTHRDPIALAACAAMAVGVARLVRGDTLPLVLEQMVAAAARYSPRTAEMMARALDDASSGTSPEQTLDRLRGWSAHEAIAAATFLLARHPDDPRAAILQGANTPGDSDSIASIAGALLGARSGITALPEVWVREVERSRELRRLALRAAGVSSSARAEW